ncbi:MAG: tetratricopeptide repeat protein [Gilvibacter sp.]
MRTLWLLICLFSAQITFGQSDALAKRYYDEGSYDKSLRIYQSIYDKNPRRLDIFRALVATHQQLEQYDIAGQLLQDKVTGPDSSPTLLIELGYNYELQGIETEAQKYYNLAYQGVDLRPNYARFIGDNFDKYGLLEWAVKSYERGMELSPTADFNFQLARIYGELGEFEKMFNKYIDALIKRPNYNGFTKRNFDQYISEEADNEANQILKKLLIKRSQQDPKLIYNELLSWLFVQQGEYKKAFAQERAIFKRDNSSLDHIIELAGIVTDAEQYEMALEIYEYVIQMSQIEEEQLQAHRNRMAILVKTEPDSQKVLNAFNTLFETYGLEPNTHTLQIDYNHYLAFSMGRSDEAIENLKTLLKKRFNRFQESRVKMELADILVFTEKFNQALIYYSQIQKKVEGNVIAQRARFKVARTSYFKGDFKWSQIQLDVLKKSTSQLIANDAMELSLLISDNSVEDSTQTALKKYAKADLLSVQLKNAKAIALLDGILNDHKGEAIEDEALFKQAQLYEATGNYPAAEANYLKIIETFKEDILADDAIYHLARLYDLRLAQPEKARLFYEQIVFEFSDSIYFVDARKRYRNLRGDDIN